MHTIDPREKVRTKRRCLIRLGVAPDGLPLVLDLDRGGSPDHLLEAVAKTIGVDTDPARWTGALRTIAAEVSALVDARQFIEHEGKTFYLSWRDLKALTGQTLLERLIPQRRPQMMEPEDDLRPVTQLNPDTIAQLADSRHAVQELVQRARSLSGSKLAVGVDTEDVAIARAPKNDATHPCFERPFIEERLDALRSSRAKITAFDGVVHEVPFGQEYRRVLDASDHRALIRRFEVPLAELLRLCVKIAHALEVLHKKRTVHGDIKPANILVGREGVELIDSLDVPVGEAAPGLSRGYAPPEQVLGQVLSPAADQYAFAVLVVRLTAGILHGRESTFVVPVGGSETQRFPLLENPRVYLDGDRLRMSSPTRAALANLLSRCLMFHPQERFPSMREVAGELEAIVGAGAFFSTVDGELSFGELRTLSDGPVWVMKDEHPTV